MKIKKICLICGKEFEVIPCRQNIAKYCSYDCYYKSRIGKKYSIKLRQKISKSLLGKPHPWQIKRITLICKYCKNKFVTQPSNKNQQFCSRQCKDKWQSITFRGFNSPKNKRKLVNCEYCSKEFIARGYRLDKGQGRFCSARCWGIWSKIHMPKKETSIEKILNERLKKVGLSFETQKPIGRIAVVDFLIKGKLIVQADGDYFHSLPKMQIKDKRQDKILKEMGYTILRFLGSKIKENPDECIRAIRENITV